MQIDVSPTILGLLGIDAGDRMIGLNLLNHNRKYAFFSADDKIGVVDGELFYLFRAKQDNESLYRYRECDTEDLIDRYPERAAAMRRYAFGMTQESQRMLLEGKTACDNNQ
jgi:phosphoglycerol transferase MdoB-like AlkP superfamily enzyme